MSITPQQATQQLKRMGDRRSLQRVVTNAFRRGAGRIRSDAIRTFRSRGVGRALFGKKGKGAQGLIKVSRVRTQGESIEMDIKAIGLAAIQEQGGRIKPHVIKAKNAPFLVFRVAGRLIFTKAVNHPGATHPVMPSLAPALERGAPLVGEEITRSMDEHLDAALR